MISSYYTVQPKPLSSRLLRSRKNPLKPVKKALLLSLLYDNFQTTGQLPDQAMLQEFLRRVA